MRTRSLEERVELVAAFREQVLPLFQAEGRKGGQADGTPTDRPSAVPPSRPPVRPVVHAVYPFSDLAAAHGAMERNEGVGKIVLTW
jgi:hypothetical protein